ncbi:VOC family protein [Croceiramulus getboli]|nr:VOC family protein [Flavobacteriaceae bacterium YJPT1-3]
MKHVIQCKFCNSLFRVIIFSLLGVLQVAQAQSKAELGVGAIGLVVSDIEVSEQFYTEILMMKLVGEFSLDEQWSREAGASDGKPFSVKRFVTVDAPTATELKLAYFDETQPGQKKPNIAQSAGVNYITFSYSAEAFQKVLKNIEEAGLSIPGMIQRDAYQLFFIQDPDGIFVEIVGPPK